MTDHTDLLHALVRFCRERQQHYMELSANVRSDTWANSHYTGAIAGFYEMELHLQQLIDRPSPPTDHTDPEKFTLQVRIQELEAENARLREAVETWATDYAVQDKCHQATAEQRNELEAENTRLREDIETWKSEFNKLANCYREIAEQFDAENARLRNEVDNLILSVRYYSHNYSEARQWARYWKRQAMKETTHDD